MRCVYSGDKWLLVREQTVQRASPGEETGGQYLPRRLRILCLFRTHSDLRFAVEALSGECL